MKSSEHYILNTVKEGPDKLHGLSQSSSGNNSIGPGKVPRRHRGFLPILLIGVALLILFLVGYLPRRARNKSLDTTASELDARKPAVIVAKVRRAPTRTELTLPGSVQAITESPLLARADGYLQKRMADIGDHVRSAQALATIEAPELDHQVLQARATFQQASASLAQAQANLIQQKANEQLATVTAQRWNTLSKRGVVSRQEDDQKQAAAQAESARTQAAEATVRVAQENIGAARANMDRLLQLQDYKTVRAPFAGVVTARNVDVGTLIASGNSILFRIAQIDVLRIFVNVPQSDQPAVQLGSAAEVTVQQLPGEVFHGTVRRTANALDPNSRTLLTEIHVANSDGSLLPGMYARVKLINLRTVSPLLIPGDCVVSGAKGTEVAALRAGNVVYFKKITLGRDYGTEVEILAGLQDGEQVIVNPTDDVREGAIVRPTELQEKMGTSVSATTGTSGTGSSSEPRPTR